MPIRIELGPRDVEKSEFVMVRRDTGDKKTSKLNGATEFVKLLLEDIHVSMFAKLVANLFNSVNLKQQ